MLSKTVYGGGEHSNLFKRVACHSSYQEIQVLSDTAVTAVNGVNGTSAGLQASLQKLK